MSFLLSPPPTSYSSELLSSSFATLTTIPIQLPPSPPSSSYTTSSPDPPTPSAYESALKDLSTAKPLTRSKLQGILTTLAKEPNARKNLFTAKKSGMDQALELEVLARAVTLLWKETMDELLDGATKLEEEIGWWYSVLESRRYIGTYLIQTLPHRLFKLLPSPLSLQSSPLHQLQFKLPHLNQLFHQNHFSKTLPQSLRTLQIPMANPLSLTRQEILLSLKELRKARDEVADMIGFMAFHGPKWEGVSTSSESKPKALASYDPSSTTNNTISQLLNETTRVFALLCVVLEVPNSNQPPSPPQPALISPSTTPRKPKSSTRIPSPPPSQPSQYDPPTPTTLLPLLTTSLPSLHSKLLSPLTIHSRPSPLTRLWIPLLLLPPILSYTRRTTVENQAWIKEQLRNGVDTVKGWVIGWVWEPLEGVVGTLRGGGEGLGVAVETVRSDQASLERMVLDLGKDHYHLSGEALAELGQKVQKGDMEDVLRVYEGEMKSPLKNAVAGSLIRTLLIQVQKTKVDLSLALLSLDHLLKSQQLTFAFVGLAPSLLVLYGIGGWARRVWSGEKRGKGRKNAWSQGVRNIEKQLILAGKGEKEMTDRERGLLILSVGSLRSWAAGLRSRSRDALLDDLRMLENPELSRNDKLRVVERMWRGWGESGRRTPGN